MSPVEKQGRMGDERAPKSIPVKASDDAALVLELLEKAANATRAGAWKDAARDTGRALAVLSRHAQDAPAREGEPLRRAGRRA